MAHVIMALAGPPRLYVDPAVALDGGLADVVVAGQITDLVREIERAAAAGPDDRSVGDALAGYISNLDFLDGPPKAYRQFALALLSRAREVAADPTILPEPPPLRDGMAQPRRSAFADPDLELRATEAIMALHTDEIETLRNWRSGWTALSLHADLAGTLGVTGQVIAELDPAGTSFDLLAGETVEVTGATLIVCWDRFERRITPANVFPELSLDPTVRQAFPALCHFFGTGFGPGGTTQTDDVLWAMESLKNPAFTQVRDELDRLLLVKDDDEVRRIVEHCGSYVLPEAVRHWVGRLRWRFDAFDWQPDTKGRIS